MRPIEPGDAAGVRASFNRLSALSRYKRFLEPVGHLSDGRLAGLTHVDRRTNEALVAIHPATSEGIGTARFVCDPSDPAEATVSIVVADEWHGRGVGRALAEALRHLVPTPPSPRPRTGTDQESRSAGRGPPVA